MARPLQRWLATRSLVEDAARQAIDGVVAASRRSGVDAVTGDGLAEALGAAPVVVDVSDAPP